MLSAVQYDTVQQCSAVQCSSAFLVVAGAAAAVVAVAVLLFCYQNDCHLHAAHCIITASHCHRNDVTTRSNSSIVIISIIKGTQNNQKTSRLHNCSQASHRSGRCRYA
jgi:hypothetical protein